MTELPSFFNKADFLGVLLPGYIAIILWLVLFFPDSILNREQTNTPLSVDLFTAVIFLVAGPALGFTVQQFHRYLYSAFALIFRRRVKRNAIVMNYARIRSASNADEKIELDLIEAYYDFDISTFIVLFLISIFYLFVGPHKIIVLPILIIAIILLLAGIFERKESYWPCVENLGKKYNIK